jgi:hypothetical protein
MKTQPITRRTVIGTTAVALAAWQVPRMANAAQRAVQGGGGVAGGGSVQLSDGTDASFSVFATRLTEEAGTNPLILGTVLLFAGGKMYASSHVSDYGPDEDNPDARHIEGFMTIESVGQHPFVVNLPDVAANNFGVDTVGIRVFASVDTGTPQAGTPAATPVLMGDPIFIFEGPLTTGDVQLLDLKFTE